MKDESRYDIYPRCETIGLSETLLIVNTVTVWENSIVQESRNAP